MAGFFVHILINKSAFQDDKTSNFNHVLEEA
jgi:hypothetical protein